MAVPTISIDELRSRVQSSSSLSSDGITNAVREAFIGRSSLGSLQVRVPGFDNLRRNALTLGAWFALDPAAEVSRSSCRNIGLGEDARVVPGWSGNPGREDHRIQSGYYCNLREELTSNPSTDEVFGTNIWPRSVDGSYSSEFKDALVDAGSMMHEVTLLVLEAAREAALYEARASGLLEGNDFKRITTPSDTFLPLRLTYYDAKHSREDTLTGGQYLLPWHVDFNMATAFIAAEWIDEDRALQGHGIDEIRCNEDNPEHHAGLLLRNAAGDVVPASIAEDCILIQLGAYAQLASGGLLRAGPHAVGLQSEGNENPMKGRLTLGLFTYAPWGARMLPPSADDEATVLEDDYGGLMQRAYTGDTVLAGFQSFANYMNAPQRPN